MPDKDKKEPEAVTGNNKQNNGAAKGAEVKGISEERKSQLIYEATRKLEALVRSAKSAEELKLGIDKICTDPKYAGIISFIQGPITTARSKADELQSEENNKALNANTAQAEKDNTPEGKLLGEMKGLNAEVAKLLVQAKYLNEDITRTTDALSKVEADLINNPEKKPTKDQRKIFKKAKKDAKKYEKRLQKLEARREQINAERKRKQTYLDKYEEELKDLNISLERTQELKPVVEQHRQEVSAYDTEIKELDAECTQVHSKFQALKDMIKRVGSIFTERSQKKVQAAEVEEGSSITQTNDDLKAAVAKQKTQQSKQVESAVQDVETGVTTANNDIKHATQADKTPADSTKLSSPIKSFFNGIIGKVKAAVNLVTNQFTPHQEHENVQKKQDTHQAISNKGTLINLRDNPEHSQSSNPTTRIDPLRNPKAFAKSCTAIFSQQTCVATGKPYSKTTLKKMELGIESHYTELRNVGKGKEHGDLGKTLKKDKDKIKAALERKTDKTSHTDRNNKSGHSDGTGYVR